MKAFAIDRHHAELFMTAHPLMGLPLGIRSGWQVCSVANSPSQGNSVIIPGNRSMPPYATMHLEDSPVT